jgi:hypothetical protein
MPIFLKPQSYWCKGFRKPLVQSQKELTKAARTFAKAGGVDNIFADFKFPAAFIT